MVKFKDELYDIDSAREKVRQKVLKNLDAMDRTYTELVEEGKDFSEIMARMNNMASLGKSIITKLMDSKLFSKQEIAALIKKHKELLAFFGGKWPPTRNMMGDLEEYIGTELWLKAFESFMSLDEYKKLYS